MSALADQLYAQARIVSVSKPNQVAQVCKLADGSLRVTQVSGNVFTLDARDVDLQAFVIWTMLNPNASGGVQ